MMRLCREAVQRLLKNLPELSLFRVWQAQEVISSVEKRCPDLPSTSPSVFVNDLTTETRSATEHGPEENVDREKSPIKQATSMGKIAKRIKIPLQ